MLRSIRLNDISDILAIERLAQVVPWTEEIFEQCLLQGYPAWVVELDKKVIGFIMVVVTLDECHILNLSIRPEYQRHGWGSKLLELAIAHMKKLAINFAYLEVRRSNTRAIALYTKMGFSQIGVRKGYYPVLNGREDALVLGKSLI